jgi:hypothetical protein
LIQFDGELLEGRAAESAPTSLNKYPAKSSRIKGDLEWHLALGIGHIDLAMSRYRFGFVAALNVS